METQKSTLEAPGISRQMFVSFVRELFNGYPNPDGDPLPPGPWDPVIRAALKRMAALYRWGDYQPKPPRPNWSQLYAEMPGVPDPWQPVSVPGLPDPWQWSEPWRQLAGDSLAALNPQPLPPVFLFAAAIANQIISDAVSRQELVDLIGTETGNRNSERVKHFVDDWCGTGVKLRWPFPVPPPPPWWRKELSGAQLVVIGVQFEHAAASVFNEGLQKAFAGAAAKFIKTGLSRME